MKNIKYINVGDNLCLKIEIYEMIREIYLYERVLKETTYITSLNLRDKNDKVIYNELVKVKNENDLIDLQKKYSW